MGGDPAEWQQQRARLQAAPLHGLRARRQQRLQRAREDLGAHAWKVLLFLLKHAAYPHIGGHGSEWVTVLWRSLLSAVDKASTSSLQIDSVQ